MTPKQAEAIAALDNEIIKKAIRNAFDSGHAAGIREAYEDAARIAEKTDWESMGSGWRVRDRIAAAIRARASEGLMKQVEQPSQQIASNKPDSGKDS
jgi:hypothetical protein